MSMRVLLLLALSAAPLWVAPAALSHRGNDSGCKTGAGSVVGYLPTANHSCASPVVVGATLFGGDFLSTGAGGEFTFQTPFLFRCHELSSSADVVNPTAKIALRHLWGTTWCRHRVSDPKAWLQVGGATIRTSGTILGLTTGPTSSTISVVQGAATITSTNPPGQVTVTQGNQLSITAPGVLQRPARLTLSPNDQVVVTELQLFVTPLGLPQVTESLKSHGEASVVVIGHDAATATQAAASLGVRAGILTTDQVRAQPQIVNDELKKFGSHTVVTVGDLAVLEPIWALLRPRTGSLLPPGTSLLYLGS